MTTKRNQSNKRTRQNPPLTIEDLLDQWDDQADELKGALEDRLLHTFKTATDREILERSALQINRIIWRLIDSERRRAYEISLRAPPGQAGIPCRQP